MDYPALITAISDAHRQAQAGARERSIVTSSFGTG